MTSQTGSALVARALDDGNAPPSHPSGAPSAAPSRFHAGSAAVPQIAVRKTEYAITATISGRRLAHAVRTVHGWHMPTSGRNRRPEWETYDDTASAATGVYLLAVARAHKQKQLTK